eukprot:m51a1_g8779 hypothetical protein (95) ;mRNA; f:186282-186839
MVEHRMHPRVVLDTDDSWRVAVCTASVAAHPAQGSSVGATLQLRDHWRAPFSFDFFETLGDAFSASMWGATPATQLNVSVSCTDPIDGGSQGGT